VIFVIFSQIYNFVLFLFCQIEGKIKTYPGAIPNGIYQLEIETTNGSYHKRVAKMD